MGRDLIEVNGSMRPVYVYCLEEVNDFIHEELAGGLAGVLHFLQGILVISVDFDVSVMVGIVIIY